MPRTYHVTLRRACKVYEDGVATVTEEELQGKLRELIGEEPYAPSEITEALEEVAEGKATWTVAGHFIEDPHRTTIETRETANA